MNNKTVLNLVRLTHLLALPVLYMIPSMIMKIVILYYICSDYFYHDTEFINNKILKIPHFLSIIIIIIYTFIISKRSINIFSIKVIITLLIYLFFVISRYIANNYYKNDYNKNNIC